MTNGWTLDNANEAITLVSNGTGWYISSQICNTSPATNWALGGNGVNAIKKIGTTSNFSLPFITNNTERMRITEGGRLGIGTSSPVTETHIQAVGVTSGILETY